MAFYFPIIAVWMCAGLVWLIGAASSKTIARVEAPGSRLGHILIMIVAFYLVFDPRLNVGPLNGRFIPGGPPYEVVGHWSGLALTVAGVAFAIWARLTLGGNWSANVTVKQGHELKRTGPYAFVRHPIYSGFLLGLLGTSIAFGEWRDLVGLVLAFIGWKSKSLVEERFMREQFGEQYVRYQSEVKALIPFIY